MIPFLKPLIDALLAQTPDAAQAAWPNGPSPIGLRATADVPVQQYIDWIVAVESGLPGRAPKEIIRRVRRMHYSNFSVKLESSTSQTMDELIGGTVDNPDGEPPLTTAHVGQPVLDGLFSTSSILTAAGHKVDITHALNIMDFAANGRSLYGGLAGIGTFVLPNYESADAELVFASLGWLGDLASVWYEWMEKRPSRTQATTLTGTERTIFEQALTDRCPLGDLLGDIDGAMLATFPGLSLQPLSTTLASYYGGEASAGAVTAPHMNSRQRFHYFVDRSIPEFTHTRLAPAPLRRTVDASNTEMIVTVMKRLTNLTWHQYSAVAEEDPATHDPIFLELANRFLKWLQDGLADPNCGVPAWPPAPTARPR